MLHTIGEGLPQPRLCPCKVRTLQSLRLFEHPSPNTSSGILFNQGSKTPGTSPFGALPPVCAFLQELRHVPHWLVYWSHSHLSTVTAVVRSLCSLFWFKAFPTLHAPPLRMMAVHLEWITVSFSSSPNHMVPSLSHLVSLDNNTSNIFSFTCLRLVSNCCYCIVSVTDRPWRFHVVICFNSFFLLPSLLFLRFFLSILQSQLLRSSFLIPFLHGGPRLGWIFLNLIADRHFARLSALPLKIPSVGTIRTFSIQFVFRGVEGGWPFATF